MTEQAPQQPIIINNTTGGMQPRKTHSIILHLILLIFTGGIGNIIYWIYIHNWNAKRGL
jgi:hypothetical protein